MTTNGPLSWCIGSRCNRNVSIRRSKSSVASTCGTPAFLVGLANGAGGSMCSFTAIVRSLCIDKDQPLPGGLSKNKMRTTPADDPTCSSIKRRTLGTPTILRQPSQRLSRFRPPTTLPGLAWIASPSRCCMASEISSAIRRQSAKDTTLCKIAKPSSAKSSVMCYWLLGGETD